MKKSGISGCRTPLMIMVINCNGSRRPCLIFLIVWPEYSLFKLIFDKDVKLFLNEYDNAPKMKTLKLAHYIKIC